MKKVVAGKGHQAVFKDQLSIFQSVIDKRIAGFITSIETDTAERFGQLPLIVTQAFTGYLRRGGKRIRGALTITGYELFGGEDKAMITEAALAIEMLQAYILMMDDIQDRSNTRRGGPTAHIMLRDYHEKNHLRDDAMHFGESMTMNAFMVGCHSALSIVTGLDVEPDRLLKALQNIHQCFVTTAQGQTMDIFNEVVETVDEQAVNNVLEWKTAYYTFVNPLHFGAILAGANDKDLQNIYDYAIPAGKAFQITDDILGIFGEEFESGKSPFDDIKEGKRTIITIKALELAPAAHAYFLETCLGKHDLTMAEFKQCRKIISESGALDYAKALAESLVNEAIGALRNEPDTWNKDSLSFLENLARFLINRKA